jgi:hypothetical protein
MSDADEAVLGKRARDDVPPAPVVEESDDEDIGPMPLPAGAGAKKKRKGASTRAGQRVCADGAQCCRMKSSTWTTCRAQTGTTSRSCTATPSTSVS